MPALPMDRFLESLSHHPWLATATAVVVALIAVYEMRARSESLVSVTPQELIRLMNQGALLLDLRPPEQYQVGHLAGARQMSGEQLLKAADTLRSEEHTSELQSHSDLVCRLLLEKKKKKQIQK